MPAPNLQDMDLFISWNVVWGHDDPKFASLSEDAEKLRRQSQAMEQAQGIWKSWLLRSMGSPINFEGAAGRAQVPADQIRELDLIREQVSQALGDVNVGVGVGLKLSESDLALKAALKRGGACIVFYTDQIPKELAEKEDDGLAKATPQAQEGENSQAAGGGFSGAQQASNPAQAQAPATEASEHSQGEAAASAAEAGPAPQESTHAGADFENQFREHADSADKEDADNQAQTEQGQKVADLKQQVVRILQGIRSQAPLLQQLQAVEPELFAAIQGMTQAMLLMAKQLLGTEDIQKNEDDVDPILKAEALFREAAFKGKDGRVVGTGPCHDLNQLPQDFEIHSEGFLGKDGNFYDRHEAAAIVGAPDHDAVSEELTSQGQMKKKEELDPAQPSPGEESKVLAKRAKSFKSKDGVSIPASGGDERRSYDKKFVAGIKESFGHLGEMKARTIPIADIAHESSGNRVVNKHRYNLYRRMLAAGDRLPPIVVRRGGLKYNVIDGSHRIAAALDHGQSQLHAIEITSSPVKKADENPDLEKGKLPLPESAPKFTHRELPVGSQIDSGPGGTGKGGRIKVQHGPEEGGKTGWVQVRAGQVLSQDGHSVSSRNAGGK